MNINLLRRIKPFISTYSQTLTRFLPQQCLLCSHKLNRDERGLCQSCYLDAKNFEQRCLKCNHLLHGHAFYFCGSCQKQPSRPAVLYACRHDHALSQGISKMKHHRNFSHIYPLIKILKEKIIEFNQEDNLLDVEAIVPVPLHPKRLQARGFNQAYVIAKYLSEHFNLPLLSDAFIKMKHTDPQTHLSKTLRSQNLKHAFQLKTAIPFESIALVDDVYTTGATTDELLQLLPNKKFQIWTLSRTFLPEK